LQATSPKNVALKQQKYKNLSDFIIMFYQLFEGKDAKVIGFG